MSSFDQTFPHKPCSIGHSRFDIIMTEDREVYGAVCAKSNSTNVSNYFTTGGEIILVFIPYNANLISIIKHKSTDAL